MGNFAFNDVGFQVGFTLPIIGQRYQLMNKLGEGGMGAVYRAMDRLTGQQVALKRVTMPADLPIADGSDPRLALAQEFTVLAGLRHPNIISVLDYGFDAEHQPYFTMELVEQPQTILEAGIQRDFETKIMLLAQMLQALLYLHRRGVIHRDLKPANVLVTKGVVRLVDFGLAGAGTQAAGTLSYMAPEILLGRPASPRSDLYAAGVMAYELFAGRHPFRDWNLTTLMDDILDAQPDLQPIDDWIAPIVGKLLEKTPGMRYADAREALVAFNQQLEAPLVLETQHTRESFLQAAQFVGRTNELNDLLGALERTIQGQGSAWMIRGESGVGKSRLLDEVRTQALIRGATVIRAVGVNHGGAAYDIWQTVIQRLILIIAPTTEEASSLKSLIPNLDKLLGRQVPNAPEIDPKAAQMRLFSTVADMFRRLPAPLLFVALLEDLQWASAESIDLLEYLVDYVNNWRVLFIGSYRDDEGQALNARFLNFQRIRLDRFNQGEVEALSASILGASGHQPEVLALLQKETEGNAFFVVEVIRALAEEAGQIDQIGNHTLPAEVFTGGMQRILQRRLAQIPEADQPLLSQAAVIGRQIDLDLLRHLDPDANLDQWLLHCANAAVLAINDGQWKFAHDKLREHAQHRLSPDQQQQMNQRAAEAIESVYAAHLPKYAAALAFHWSKAGNPIKEAEYAFIAGEVAAANFSNAEAVRLLRRALDLTNRIESTQWLKLVRALIGVLIFTGDIEQASLLAEEMWQTALHTKDVVELAAARTVRGDVCYEQDNFRQALDWYEQALRDCEQLGDSLQMAKAMFHVANTASEFGQAERSMDMLQQALTRLEAYPQDDVYRRILAAIGNILFEQTEYARALEYQQRALAIAEKAGNRRALGPAYGNIGITHILLNDFTQAMEALHRQLEVNYETGYKAGMGNCLHNMGELYRATGQPKEAATCLLNGLEIAFRLNAPMSVAIRALSFGKILADQGDSPLAAAFWETSLSLGRKVKSDRVIASVLCQLGELRYYQNRFEDTQILMNEALPIGERNQNSERIYTAKLYLTLSAAALQTLTIRAAINVLETMLGGQQGEPEQANLHYQIWRLDPTQQLHKEQAEAIYKNLWKKAPHIDYHEPLMRLTGDSGFPEPAKLPPPPGVALLGNVDSGTLLQRLRDYVEKVPAAT